MYTFTKRFHFKDMTWVHVCWALNLNRLNLYMKHVTFSGVVWQSEQQVYLSFMLKSLLLLVETIYTLYMVILAYHTIQDVENYIPVS